MYDKVLVVDDEPEVIEGLKVALRKEPYEVVGASSAGAARMILAKEPVGVIVVDERMPGQSGSDFLIELAKEQPHLPKIMLTGHADLQLAMRSINQGHVFRLLQKPCQTEELATAIRDALRKHAVKSVTQRIVHLSRRQAVLVEELDRESGGAVEASTGLMHTQEVASVPVSEDEADPVAMLTHDEAANLSRREKEILRAMVAGKKPRELAHMFFISVHTARNHVKAIYRKLGVHSQGELIAKVLRAPGRLKFRPAS